MDSLADLEAARNRNINNLKEIGATIAAIDVETERITARLQRLSRFQRIESSTETLVEATKVKETATKYAPDPWLKGATRALTRNLDRLSTRRQYQKEEFLWCEAMDKRWKGRIKMMEYELAVAAGPWC